ncbi:MAG TPA: dodecin domain-containing protein [Chloroflexi bacterium]|jgi:flavin-binding protein dodecin|nr:dodecin domain-containing protein [Chloroflexota bacterium]
MAVVKVIEILAESEVSWEDAAQQALTEVARTVRNIKRIYVQDFQAIVENNRIVRYRVNAKVSFLVESRRGLEA